MTKEYHATARRDGRYWIIEIPEIGQTTQARTTAESEVMARDLIATMLDIPSNSYAVTMHYILPTGVVQHLDHAEQLRNEAARANAAAAAEVRSAAAELRDSGLGLRDIGKVMGVSHQRAGQLVGAKAKPDVKAKSKPSKREYALSGG